MNHNWMNWGSLWNTTIVVRDSAPVRPLTVVGAGGYDLPVLDEADDSIVWTSRQEASDPVEALTSFRRSDGSVVIASRAQAWEILAGDDAELASEVFAAFLVEEPGANDLLLGYGLALAQAGRFEIAGD